MKRAILAILLATLVFGAIACGPSERGFSGKRALSWVRGTGELGTQAHGKRGQPQDR